jgi:hypothetical protein
MSVSAAPTDDEVHLSRRAIGRAMRKHLGAALGCVVMRTKYVTPGKAGVS